MCGCRLVRKGLGSYANEFQKTLKSVPKISKDLKFNFERRSTITGGLLQEPGLF